MTQGIVDLFEAVTIAQQHGAALSATVRVNHRGSETILEQHAVRQAGQRIVGREMPQLPVGGFESLGTDRNDLLERGDLAAHGALVLPFSAQCRSALKHLNRLEWLAQHQKLVGVAEPAHDVDPVIVRVCGTNHDLRVRIHSPQVLDGLEAVPAGRHPHVDEGHAVGAPCDQCLLRHRDPVAPLEREVDLEARPLRFRRRLAEKNRFRGQEYRVCLGFRIDAQHLAKIRMDRGIVVDDENASHVGPRTQGCRSARGSSSVNVAPHPGPSLLAVSAPPSSRAVSAPLCSPNPCPEARVVKPCVKRRDMFSARMPMPLSATLIRTRSSSPSTRIVMVLSARPDSSQAYFALRTRLTRICSTLCLSTVIGGNSAISRRNVMPWRASAPAFMRRPSSTSAATATVSVTPHSFA